MFKLQEKLLRAKTWKNIGQENCYAEPVLRMVVNNYRDAECSIFLWCISFHVLKKPAHKKQRTLIHIKVKRISGQLSFSDAI